MISRKRADLIVALACFCANYHSGQWSRGYRLLSLMQRIRRYHCLPWREEEDLSPSQRRVYDRLVETYAFLV